MTLNYMKGYAPSTLDPKKSYWVKIRPEQFYEYKEAMIERDELRSYVVQLELELVTLKANKCHDCLLFDRNDLISPDLKEKPFVSTARNSPHRF